MIRDPYALLVVFLGVTALASGLEQRYPLARKVSAVLIILFASALLSNTGVIARDAPLYGDVIDLTVPFAVCLVLFTVRLKDLKHAGPAMTVAFAVACAGTFLGALGAGALLHRPLAAILGGDAWKLAGPFTGTYTGGSLNFFAVWTGLGIGRPDLLAAANAVDNLTLFPLFTIWVLVPDLLGRFFPAGSFWGSAVSGHRNGGVAACGQEEMPRFRIAHVATLAFIALAVVWASDSVVEGFIVERLPNFPSILVVTTAALILAQCGFMRRLEGAATMGDLAFRLFFCAVGAMIDLERAVSLCPILFLYVMIMIAVHMLVIYGVGRMLRIDVRILTVASAAAKAGPPCILALANVKGWRTLVLPGVAMGLLGYAVGNYLGFAAAAVMRVLLGA